MSEVNSFSLRNKVVIQFGGTGLLGRALVSALGGAGATLIIASRNRSALTAFAAIEQAAGSAVQVDEVDIGSEAALRALRDRVLAQHGRGDGIFLAVLSTLAGALTCHTP